MSEQGQEQQEQRRGPGRPKKAAEPTTTMPDMGAWERQKLERDANRARTAQKRALEAIKARTEARDSAPGGVQALVAPESPREEEVRRMFPESIPEYGDRSNPTKVTKPATISVLYDDAELHKQHVAEGWEPVIVDGEHHQDRKDLCYTRPIEISQAKHHDSGLRARQNVAGVGDELAAADPLGEVLTENRTGHSLVGE